jgi:putative spermidine/putrescine transport system permease protein
MSSVAGAATDSPHEKPARHRSRRAALVPFLLMSPGLILVVGLLGLSMLMALSEHTTGAELVSGWTTANFTKFFSEPYYLDMTLSTFKLAGTVVAITLLVGYPVAYAIHELPNAALRGIAYFLLFSPLFISVVIRAYGWSLLLGNEGMLNSTLMSLRLRSEPVPFLYSKTGVIIAFVQVLLPFMVFPILGVLDKVGNEVREAAHDLGAGRLRVFWKVVFPLTAQGAVSGATLVLAIAGTAFAIPVLLGVGRVTVLAYMVYQDFGSINWPMAAVEACVLCVLLFAAILLLNAVGRRLFYRSPGGRS